MTHEVVGGPGGAGLTWTLSKFTSVGSTIDYSGLITCDFLCQNLESGYDHFLVEMSSKLWIMLATLTGTLIPLPELNKYSQCY